MKLNFVIRYATVPGEELSVELRNNEDTAVTGLKYSEGDLWKGTTDILPLKTTYSIFLKNYGSAGKGKEIFSGGVSPVKYKTGTVNIEISDTGGRHRQKIFKAKPFQTIFKPRNIKTGKLKRKKISHVFLTGYPPFQKNKLLCITGSANAFGQFDPAKPLFIHRKKNGSGIVRVNLSKEIFPIEYKLAVYDRKRKTIVAYEEGVNRVISEAGSKNELTEIHLHNPFTEFLWKAAGINIPLFSVRTENDWGCGSFGDLKMLVDFCKKSGLKLIQLLPLNDTTSSYTDADSYPYSPVSSIALHPKYLDLQQITDQLSEEITPAEKEEISRLKSLSYSDHSAVMKLILAVAKRLFQKEKDDFRDDIEWFSFFDLNREWLVPYAAFCTLRDLHKNADWHYWKGFEKYNEAAVQEFCSPDAEHYEQVLFWYYIQYQLHLQLKEAAAYATSEKIMLKADVPVGVGRYSVDTWMYPHLFLMNMQAGAPPDAFSAEGQNWKFPVYNMEQQAFENYAWFRKRLEHLENYFAAARIDHVIGFMRLWSIPVNQIPGNLGRFIPAVALNKNDFEGTDLHRHPDRYFKPFINEVVLHEKFGADAEEVKAVFLKEGQFKEEMKDSRKLIAWFDKNPAKKRWKDPLLNLIADLLLIRDEKGGIHFRIMMQQTNSYKHLPEAEKKIMDRLYHQYFFRMQDELWKEEGEKHLKMLSASTSMLLCAEDLGMVPSFTEVLLYKNDMLSLNVLQMAKDNRIQFSDPANAKYESVVMPTTHDMSPMRLWWEENRKLTGVLFELMCQTPPKVSDTSVHEVPYFLEPWLSKKIIERHVHSPAMLAVFLLQDLLAMNGKIRRPVPAEERINDPGNGDHVWNWRIHLTMEELIANEEFAKEVKQMVKDGNRN